jgi:hypothetical protein
MNPKQFQLDTPYFLNVVGEYRLRRTVIDCTPYLRKIIRCESEVFLSSFDDFARATGAEFDSRTIPYAIIWVGE